MKNDPSGMGTGDSVQRPTNENGGTCNNCNSSPAPAKTTGTNSGGSGTPAPATNPAPIQPPKDIDRGSDISPQNGVPSREAQLLKVNNINSTNPAPAKTPAPIILSPEVNKGSDIASQNGIKSMEQQLIEPNIVANPIMTIVKYGENEYEGIERALNNSVDQQLSASAGASVGVKGIEVGGELSNDDGGTIKGLIKTPIGGVAASNNGTAGASIGSDKLNASATVDKKGNIAYEINSSKGDLTLFSSSSKTSSLVVGFEIKKPVFPPSNFFTVTDTIYETFITEESHTSATVVGGGQLYLYPTLNLHGKLYKSNYPIAVFENFMFTAGVGGTFEGVNGSIRATYNFKWKLSRIYNK